MLHLPDLTVVTDRLKRRIKKCKRCRGTGWHHVDVDDFTTKQEACGCRKEVDYKRGLIAGNIPSEFWKVETLKWVHNEQNLEVINEYCDDLYEQRRTGRGFTLLGENGAGKTGMSCLILARAIKAGYHVGYLTIHDYLTGIPRTWRDAEMKEWLDELIQADFLVLDEMGKEYKSAEASKLAEVDSLLRARRGAMRPTIVVTNLGVKGFREVYGNSIDSILSDRNRQLIYEPGDYRKRRKGK